MKVLLLGHRGWIGKYVLNILSDRKHEIIMDDDLRADNKTNIINKLDNDKPTHVICLTGRTHGTINGKYYPTIDFLEQKGKIVENIRDNLFVPLMLAELCKERNIHLTYVGTGCIFKYDDTHKFEKEENGFTEEDDPNFFGSSYSVVKGFTDRLIKMYDNTVLNVRIRMPITDDESKRNFITKITSYKKICSIKNSMSVLPELLPIMINLAENNYTGTINLVNPGLISHNEILEMYKEIIDPNFTWDNFTQEEQLKILAADRSNNYLNTDKLESMYPNVKNIKDSVRNVLVNIKNSK